MPGRSNLRIRCPKGRGGSTPPSRTCSDLRIFSMGRRTSGPRNAVLLTLAHTCSHSPCDDLDAMTLWSAPRSAVAMAPSSRRDRLPSPTARERYLAGRLELPSFGAGERRHRRTVSSQDGPSRCSRARSRSFRAGCRCSCEAVPTASGAAWVRRRTARLRHHGPASHPRPNRRTLAESGRERAPSSRIECHSDRPSAANESW
jgi:hypothetical protein